MASKVEDTLARDLEKYLDSTKIWMDGRVYHIKRFIDSVKELEIHVYPKDHWPAHFHVISKQRGINARFDISTLELISIKSGKIKEDDIKKIQGFFKERPDRLDFLRSEYARLQGS